MILCAICYLLHFLSFCNVHICLKTIIFRQSQPQYSYNRCILIKIVKLSMLRSGKEKELFDNKNVFIHLISIRTAEVIVVTLLWKRKTLYIILTIELKESEADVGLLQHPRFVTKRSILDVAAVLDASLRMFQPLFVLCCCYMLLVDHLISIFIM